MGKRASRVVFASFKRRSGTLLCQYFLLTFLQVRCDSFN